MAKDNTAQYLKQNIKIVQILLKEYLEFLRERLRQRLLQERYEEINRAAYDERNPTAVYERDIARIQADPMRYKVYGCLDNENIDVVKGILRSKDIPFSFQDATEEGRGGFYVFEAVHEQEFLKAVNEYNRQIQGLSQEAAKAKQQKLAEEGRNGTDDRERAADPEKKNKKKSEERNDRQEDRSEEDDHSSATRSTSEQGEESRKDRGEALNDESLSEQDVEYAETSEGNNSHREEKTPDERYERDGEVGYEDDEEIIKPSTNEDLDKQPDFNTRDLSEDIDYDTHDGREKGRATYGDDEIVIETAGESPENLTDDTVWLSDEIGETHENSIDSNEPFTDGSDYSEEKEADNTQGSIDEYEEDEYPHESEDIRINYDDSEEIVDTTTSEQQSDYIENPEEFFDGSNEWLNQESDRVEDNFEDQSNFNEINNTYNDQQNAFDDIQDPYSEHNIGYENGGYNRSDENYEFQEAADNLGSDQPQEVFNNNPEDYFNNSNDWSEQNQAEFQNESAYDSLKNTYNQPNANAFSDIQSKNTGDFEQAYNQNTAAFDSQGTDVPSLRNQNNFQDIVNIQDQNNQNSGYNAVEAVTFGGAAATSELTQFTTAAQTTETQSFSVVNNFSDQTNQINQTVENSFTAQHIQNNGTGNTPEPTRVTDSQNPFNNNVGAQPDNTTQFSNPFTGTNSSVAANTVGVDNPSSGNNVQDSTNIYNSLNNQGAGNSQGSELSTNFTQTNSGQSAGTNSLYSNGGSFSRPDVGNTTHSDYSEQVNPPTLPNSNEGNFNNNANTVNTGIYGANTTPLSSPGVLNPPSSGSSGIAFESSFGNGQVRAIPSTSNSPNELNVYDSGNAFDIDPYGGVVDHTGLVKAATETAKTAMDGGDKNFVKKGFKEFGKTGTGNVLTMPTYTLTGTLAHGVSEGNLTDRAMKTVEETLGENNVRLLVNILGVQDKSREDQLDAITNLLERGHIIHKNKISGKYDVKGTDWEYNRPTTPMGRHAADRTAQALYNDSNAKAHYATSGEYTSSLLKKSALSREQRISNEKAAELTEGLERAAGELANRKDLLKIGKQAGKKYYKKLKAMTENSDDFASQEVKRWKSMYGTAKQGVDILRQGRAILTNQFQGRVQREMRAQSVIMNRAGRGTEAYRRAAERFKTLEGKNTRYDQILERIQHRRENARKGIVGRVKESTVRGIKQSRAYGGLKSVGGALKRGALKIKPIKKVAGGVRAAMTALGIGKNAKDFLASGGNPVIFAIKKAVELLIQMLTNFTAFVERIKKAFIKLLVIITISVVISFSGLFLLSGVTMALGTLLMSFGTMFDINEDGEEDTASDEAITTSTYGIVYEELKKEEQEWFTNLIKEMQNKQYMSVSDTSYTDTSNLGAQMGLISGEQSGANGQVTDSTPPTHLNIIENAGQTPVAATEEEIFLLAQVIYNEAGAESYQSQVGVAEVIINRVKSSKFKETTIDKIITARGQFSDLDRARGFTAAQVAAQIPIARAVISGNLRIFNNPNILYFCNPRYVPKLNVNAATRKDWKGHGTWYAGISDTAFYYGDSNATDKNYGFSGQVVPTTTVKNASDYATQNLGTTYQNGGFKGPAPFANAPEEAYKNITIIDGEQSLVFRDANGNYGCKSNLRQILSMVMVAQEQTDNFEDNVNEDTFELLTSNSIIDKIKGVFSVITKAVEAAVNAVKNFFSNVMEAIFPSFKNWWEHHEAKKRAKVVMAYCKPLFDLSHQNEYSESMSIHPTLRTLKNSGISKEEYDGEICNGNEAQTSDATDTHNGYGCMSYNKFYYRDDNDTDVSLSENGELVMEVEPAGTHTGDDGVIPCSAPDGNADTFLARLDANPDCWDVSVGSEYESDSGAGGHSGSTVIDNAIGGTYHYSVSGKGASYTVTVQTAHHVSHDEDGDIDDEWYDLVDVTVTHHCNGTHTGYYCGGHLDNNVQSVITTWTDAEENQKEGEYFSKVTDRTTYKIAEDYAAPTNEELQAANDLFDIDMLITHLEGTVYQERDADGNIIYQFEGWTLDNMDLATSKFADDWNNLYPGIKWDDEITVSADDLGGGTTGGGTTSVGGVSNGEIRNPLSDAQITEILAAAMSQIPDDDPAKADREVAIKTALQYVGKIIYNQDYHGSALKEGASNDCSGYASRCWYNLLKNTYTVSTFKSSFPTQNFTDGQCKPGDILLSVSSGRSNYHALIYLGKINGVNISVDCTGPKGSIGTRYKSRGDSYYNKCHYINMSTLK